MSKHQDSQLNRGRCSYSPKQHTVYVLDDEEVTPYPTLEAPAPQVEQAKAVLEAVQSNDTFNIAH